MSSRCDSKRLPPPIDSMTDRPQDALETAAENASDETLMRRFGERLEDETFHLLASRHYEKAVRIAKARLGSDSAAQDAVQETYIRIVRFRKRYDPSKPFAQWFYTILRNVCTDIYRKERRHQAALAAFSDAGPALAVHHSANEKFLDLTVGLPPGDAEILSLRFVAGLSLAEIGCHLQCSMDAAKKRLQRLLKRLKK